ncbi:hypothetical protein GMMP15_780002 [Candidatus Magnetomoraceae bacterium gMMP-15]
MTNKVSFSREHSSLEDIEEYYTDSESALNYYFDLSGEDRIFSVRFIGYSKKEIENELRSRKELLDRMCSFNN